jgi:hypothetical protein
LKNLAASSKFRNADFGLARARLDFNKVNATSRSGFVVKLCLEAAAIDLKAKLSRVGYPPFVLDFLDAKDQQTQPRR